MREAPHDPARHAHLGAVLAGLGRKEDAINEGKKAVELLPESRRRFRWATSDRIEGGGLFEVRVRFSPFALAAIAT